MPEQTLRCQSPACPPKNCPGGRVPGRAALLLALFAGVVSAQTASPEWRHIGNSALELALPSVATGPVDRVWFSQDGATLYALTASGRMFESQDLEQWRVARDGIIPP